MDLVKSSSPPERDKIVEACAPHEGYLVIEITGRKRPEDESLMAWRDVAIQLVAEFSPQICHAFFDHIVIAWNRPRVVYEGNYQRAASALSSAASVLSKMPCLGIAWHAKNPTTVMEAFEVHERFAFIESVDRTTRQVRRMIPKNQSTNDKLDVLFQHGVDFDKQPTWVKHGGYLARDKYLLPLSKSQLAKIPTSRQVAGEIMRSVVIEPFKSICYEDRRHKQTLIDMLMGHQVPLDDVTIVLDEIPRQGNQA